MATIGAARAASMAKLDVPAFSAMPSMSGHIDATWKGAKRVRLAFDYANRRPQSHPPVVYIAQDPSGLDFAFVVKQSSAIRAITTSNGSGVLNDDYVGVSISPQGAQGFSYGFFANARGARTQDSSENSAYSPSWSANATIISGGYVVTMHIPFNVIRSGGKHAWKVQFLRYSVASNATDVWTYDPNQSGTSDPSFEGTLKGIQIAKTAQKATRPSPRFQPYVLAVAGSKNAGGSTSQMGLDLAVPITPTASFVGSLHPDYSNVETDQQTISPTAFPRQFTEVRPFFTQLGGNFDYTFGCSNCPMALYTVAIPTYRDSYGVEGTQGPFGFAGFNAVGTGRSDSATSVNFFSGNAARKLGINVQRVSANASTSTDSTTTINGGVLLGKSHLFGYANYGREDGTLITDPAQARYGEFGLGYVTQATTFIVTKQYVGAQYSPVDGYVAQTDTRGYISFFTHTFTFPKTSRLRDAQLSANTTRLWNQYGVLDQAGSGYQFNVDLKNLLSVHAYQGTQSVLGANGEYLPYSVGNGLMLAYNLSSNTPAGVAYSQGAYYHGHAESWQAFETYALRSHVSLSLNFNENVYASSLSSEPSFRQWLNTASVNWQFSKDASLSLGARRINGINLPNSYSPPTFTPLFADNVSAAFHYLHAHNEFYLVYGNPNSLTTTPALYFKWIVYAGAQKGT